MSPVSRLNRRALLRRLLVGGIAGTAVLASAVRMAAQPSGQRPRNPGGAGGQRPEGPPSGGMGPHDGTRPGGPPSGGMGPHDGTRPGGGQHQPGTGGGQGPRGGGRGGGHGGGRG